VYRKYAGQPSDVDIARMRICNTACMRIRDVICR
jgi:hypothetical protein